MAFFSLLVLLSYCHLSLACSGGEADERIWSVCENGSYSCGPSINNAVHCTQDGKLKIQNCYCMFYDEEKRMSFLGTCLLSCFNDITRSHSDFLSFFVEQYSVENASSLNRAMCSKTVTLVDTYREGRFCGQCQKGYGLAAYSYHYSSCVECMDYSYKNWVIYFAIALLPLTLFVLLLLILKVNVPTSHLNGIVFMIQCLTAPMFMRVYDSLLVVQTQADYQIKVARAFYAIFGFFNLDILRDVYPHFCLHPKLNILFLIFMDYIVALYPFLLILLTYIMVRMYDKNYTLIVLAWKPFKWCLKSRNGEWNIGATLTQAFASLILLSSVKMLGIMFDILATTKVTGINSTDQQHLHYFYYDANIEYLHGYHLYCALVSMFLTFSFVILPLLLLILYPCRRFHKILNFLGWRCQALYIFMDAFQGSYKLEPYDLRHFSAFHLLLRIFLLLAASFVHSPFFFPAAACLMMVGSIIFAAFRPYKNDFHNTLDVISMMLLALFFMSMTITTYCNSIDQYWASTGAAIAFASVLSTFIYITLYVVSKPLYYMGRKTIAGINLIWKFTEPALTSSIFTRHSDTPEERSSLIDAVQSERLAHPM